MTPRPQYKEGAQYRVTLHLDNDATCVNGRIRATRELATVATRYPGFVKLETRKNHGEITAFILIWDGLESVDNWRSGVYETALQRYGPDAWDTFANMELEVIEPEKSTMGRFFGSFSLARSA